jgi:hypothetical protein
MCPVPKQLSAARAEGKCLPVIENLIRARCEAFPSEMLPATLCPEQAPRILTFDG